MKKKPKYDWQAIIENTLIIGMVSICVVGVFMSLGDRLHTALIKEVAAEGKPVTDGEGSYAQPAKTEMGPTYEVHNEKPWIPAMPANEYPRITMTNNNPYYIHAKEDGYFSVVCATQEPKHYIFHTNTRICPKSDTTELTNLRQENDRLKAALALVTCQKALAGGSKIVCGAP